MLSKRFVSRLLWVTVTDLKYPVTEEALNRVFSFCGSVENVVMFHLTTELRALVCYRSPEEATSAMLNLHGRNIYDFCCRLHIQDEPWENDYAPNQTEKPPENDAPQLFDGSSEKESKGEHPSNEFLGDISVSGVRSESQSTTLISKSIVVELPTAVAGSESTEVKKDSGTQVKQKKAGKVAQMQEFQEDLVHSSVEHNLFDERFERKGELVHSLVAHNLFDERFEKELEEMTALKPWYTDTGQNHISKKGSDEASTPRYYGIKRADTTPVALKIHDASDYLSLDLANDATAQSFDVLSLICSPTDIVKKRRRTASSKIGEDVDVEQLNSEIMVGMCSHIPLNDVNSKDSALDDKMVEANHRSCVKLCVGEDIKFQRLHVTYHASIHGFKNGCLWLNFLNTTKLKSKNLEELELTLKTLKEASEAWGECNPRSNMFLDSANIRLSYRIASVERTKTMGKMLMAAIQEHRRAALEESISILEDTTQTSFVLAEMDQGRSNTHVYALFKPLAKKLREDEVNSDHWKDVFDDNEAAGHVANSSMPIGLEQIVCKIEVQFVEDTTETGKGELNLKGLFQFMARNCSSLEYGLTIASNTCYLALLFADHNIAMDLIHWTCYLVIANMVFDNG